jgi:predicted transcriptional regulator
MAAQGTSSGSFKIQGSEGPIEVLAGSYYFNTKDRCRRMMLNHLSSGARQVYACLELATMGWQRELAMVKTKHAVRPMTTGDIAGECGLDQGLVRRFLDELQDAGLAERRAKNGKGLHKGNVQIYSWAEPRVPEKEKRGRARPLFLRWIPESWKSLTAYAKRCRYELPDDLGDARDTLLAEGERLARALEEAENAAARFLEGVCAQSDPAAHNKEERTERTTEIQEAGRQASTVEEQSLPAGPESVLDNPQDEPPEPVKLASFEEIRSLSAVQELEQQVHDVVGEQLAAEIAVNLRDAPLEALDQRIRLKAKGARSLALLPRLAADVAQANDVRKQHARKATETAAKHNQNLAARAIADLRKRWHQFTDAERSAYIEIYPELLQPG